MLNKIEFNGPYGSKNNFDLEHYQQIMAGCAKPTFFNSMSTGGQNVINAFLTFY